MKHFKTLKITACLCILISYLASGQNFYLYNVNSSKTREISGPIRVKVRSEGKKEQRLKGDAMMLNDSMLFINDSLIHLNDITIIQAVTKKSIQNGIILSVVGAGFITLGTVFAIQSGNAEGIGALVKVLLSIMTYFAAHNSLFLMIKNFFWGNSYKTDSGWTLKMKNDATVIIPSGK